MKLDLLIQSNNLLPPLATGLALLNLRSSQVAFPLSIPSPLLLVDSWQIDPPLALLARLSLSLNLASGGGSRLSSALLLHQQVGNSRLRAPPPHRRSQADLWITLCCLWKLGPTFAPYSYWAVDRVYYEADSLSSGVVTCKKVLKEAEQPDARRRGLL